MPGINDPHFKADVQMRYLDWSVPFPLGRWLPHIVFLRLGLPWLILLLWQFDDGIFGLL